MTFTAYIQRQKSLIRSRQGIESKAVFKEIAPEYSTEQLLDELINLKGLNTAERQRFSKIFSHA